MRLTWPASGLDAAVAEQLTGPGSPFELVVEDVLGSPTTVFAARPKTVVDLLASGAQRFGDRPYLVFPDRTHTFETVVGAVAGVAHHLRAEHGIGKGDRVGIASANRLEYALCFWAAASLGSVTTALNGWWTGPEMAYAIGLTRPVVVFADERRCERLAGEDLAGARLCRIEELAVPGEQPSAPEVGHVEMAEDHPFLILFTSGTTGRPKGVMVSHRNNVHFGLATQLRAAELRARAQAAGRTPPAPADPCSLGASPMFHISGLNCSLVLAPMNGLTIVYPPPGRWREDVHLQLTQDHRVTTWTLVPTQLWRLLDWPELDRYDLRSVASIGGGSAVWAPELLKRLDQRLPWVRPGLGLGFGMTETCGIGTTLGGDTTYTHPDSVGQPSPTVDVEIREPGTRRPLDEGQVGEIALRSACNFLGYWDNPEATAAALDDDRWYHTGDFGHHTGGFVHLAGRRQDLIIRGGENIYPVEVENRLSENPLVAEAAVVGVPHPVLGQEVKAFVVPRNGATVTPEQVRDGCRAVLAAFKVPEYVEVVPELPRNATGKVLKHLLGTPGASSHFVEE